MSTEDREILLGYRAGAYLHGHCVPVAIALHRATGHPLIVLRQSNGLMVHVAVVLSDGRYRDIRGVIDRAELKAPYCGAPFNITEVSEADLLREAPTEEDRIAIAARHLAELFDDLPMAQEKDARAKAFLSDLAHLCKCHGFWLRGEVPNSVVLYEAYGDETGFRARRTAASDFRLERLLD